MWAIRILSGRQAGQVFPLQNGSSKIGRGTTCEIKVASDSVSKEHAQFHVTDDKLMIGDLNSRNGTFVNGIRVQHSTLKAGDKIGLHDVLFEAISLPNVQAFPQNPAYGGMAARLPNQMPSGFQAPNYGPRGGYGGAPAFDPRYSQSYASAPLGMDQMHDPLHGAPEAPAAPRFTANSLPDLWLAFQAYVENVAMPGIYALAKKMPFRYVLASYVGAFVVLVVALSTIPMASVTKASIQAESQRRARTIARDLAVMNRQYVIDGLDISVSTQLAENEDGVESALILSAKDGHIIAPVSRAGAYADRPYVLRVRKKLRSDEANDKEYVEQVDSSKIVAATPIKKFDSESRGQTVLAYAVVVYDMGSLAIDQGETISLLIENLAIALALGFILYYFLAKTIERPIIALNAQLDDALREGKDDIYVEFQFPELKQLASNVNSALSRMAKGGGPAGAELGVGASIDREAEAESLVLTSSSPALAISAVDERIIAVNDAVYQLIGGTGVDLKRKSVGDIHDQALQAHVRDLIARLRVNSLVPARDELPFPEGIYKTSAISVSGASEPAFFFISLAKSEEGGR